MEALQLDEGVAIEMNLLVALHRRIEHVVVYLVCHRTDTVYTTNALHQSGSVPWRIVVDDDVGTMQIDTFGKHIRGNHDVEFIRLLGIVGIKALAENILPIGTIAGTDIQNVVTMQTILQLLRQIIHGIYALREDNQFACRIYLFIKEFMFQLIDKQFQLRVFAYLIPFFAKLLQILSIFFQHLQEPFAEILVFKDCIFLFQAFFYGIFYDAVQFPALGLLILHVDIGSNNHLILVKHLDHILGNAEEGMKRTAEGIETALQSLDHVNTIDTCQHGGNMKGSRILLASLTLQELHGTIAGIVQALACGIIFGMRRIGKNRHRTIEEIVQTAI